MTANTTTATATATRNLSITVKGDFFLPAGRKISVSKAKKFTCSMKQVKFLGGLLRLSRKETEVSKQMALRARARRVRVMHLDVDGKQTRPRFLEMIPRGHKLQNLRRGNALSLIKASQAFEQSLPKVPFEKALEMEHAPSEWQIDWEEQVITAQKELASFHREAFADTPSHLGTVEEKQTFLSMSEEDALESDLPLMAVGLDTNGDRLYRNLDTDGSDVTCGIEFRKLGEAEYIDYEMSKDMSWADMFLSGEMAMRDRIELFTLKRETGLDWGAINHAAWKREDKMVGFEILLQKNLEAPVSYMRWDPRKGTKISTRAEEGSREWKAEIEKRLVQLYRQISAQHRAWRKGVEKKLPGELRDGLDYRRAAYLRNKIVFKWLAIFKPHFIKEHSSFLLDSLKGENLNVVNERLHKKDILRKDFWFYRVYENVQQKKEEKDLDALDAPKAGFFLAENQGTKSADQEISDAAEEVLSVSSYGKFRLSMEAINRAELISDRRPPVCYFCSSIPIRKIA